MTRASAARRGALFALAAGSVLQTRNLGGPSRFNAGRGHVA
jgi:hypothetical protein